MGTGNTKRRPRRKLLLHKAGIKSKMALLYPNKGNTSFAGKHGNDPFISKPRTYAQQRLGQFLQHFAGVLKTYFNAQKGFNEIEIQIALINNRQFMLSANADSTVDYFMGQVYDLIKSRSVSTVGSLAESYTNLGKQVLASVKDSKALIKHRFRRQTGKFVKALAGNREAAEFKSITDLMRTARLQSVIELDAVKTDKNEIRRFVAAEMTGTTTALVKAEGKNWHAEQKILYALVKSGVKDAVVEIAGTFRPCAGCFQSLELVKKYFCRNLRFGSHPGHYWNTTDDCFIAILKLLVEDNYINNVEDAKKYIKDLKYPGTYRSNIRIGGEAGIEEEKTMLNYCSDSDSDSES